MSVRIIKESLETASRNSKDSYVLENGKYLVHIGDKQNKNYKIYI